MANILFSPQAINDINQLKAYIAIDLYSQQAAENTVKKIMQNIRILATFPEMGTSLTPIVGFNTDYKFLVCDNYTTFYRIEDEKVYIVRILYGRRDYMRILFGNPSE